MHHSPPYALLQAIEELHAEYKQHVRKLEVAASEHQLTPHAHEKVLQTTRRVERLFRTLESDALLAEGRGGPIPARQLARRVRGEWEWLHEILVRLHDAFPAEQMTCQLCDDIMRRLEQWERKAKAHVRRS